MTTPIKPMSAEKAIKYAVANLEGPGIHRNFIRPIIRSALASHLAYVKEKMPVYVTEKVAQSGAVAYVNEDPELIQRNIGVDACRAILQSEIDELTK